MLSLQKIVRRKGDTFGIPARWFAAFCAATCLGVSLPFAAMFLQGETTSDMKKLEAYAQEVLATCEGVEYRPACYDEEIPKLMDYISMEEAFEVTRIVQQHDDTYWYCHVLGHNLSARETAKDPSKWKDVIARSPTGVCSNGSIHGAFQERFRVESLQEGQREAFLEEIRGVCEPREGWNPTGMEQATCYHAVGHLTMYATQADIEASIAMCDVVAVQDEGRRDYSQLCYDGAFMQIFQPLEPEDFTLIEGKQPAKDEVTEFCYQFSGSQRGSCLSESWPLFFEEIRTSQGVIDLCSKNTDQSQINRCYNALFYVITPQLDFDPDQVEAFCGGFSKERTSVCFGNAASRTIETDSRLASQAVLICERAPIPEARQSCFGELLFYSSYNFHPGSEAFLAMCNALPSPWKEECFSGEKRTL